MKKIIILLMLIGSINKAYCERDWRYTWPGLMLGEMIMQRNAFPFIKAEAKLDYILMARDTEINRSEKEWLLINLEDGVLSCIYAKSIGFLELQVVSRSLLSNDLLVNYNFLLHAMCDYVRVDKLDPDFFFKSKFKSVSLISNVTSITQLLDPSNPTTLNVDKLFEEAKKAMPKWSGGNGT